MKLYTEEQVKNFLKERTFMTEDAIDKLCAPLIPIELPSDEEIEQELASRDELIDEVTYMFIEGAKWMKDKLLTK